MKAIPVIALLFSLSAWSQQTIFFEDGSSFEVPEGKKIIIVDESVEQDGLVRVQFVPFTEPETEECTPSDELSTGAPPCED